MAWTRHGGGGGTFAVKPVQRAEETESARVLIAGGRPLSGRVRAGGRKNSALAVIPATLLADGPSVIENVPQITDVVSYLDILRTLGAKVRWLGESTVEIDPTGLRPLRVPDEFCRQLRASYYMVSVLLARHGRAEVPLPGGDDIGQRPIDQHIKGLRALGADVAVEHGIIHGEATTLKGASIYLDVVSVGATINLMLAATLAEGTTLIENAAKESHVADVANYLNAAGARIQGAGTDVIRVRGVPRLHGTRHAIIPDDIEAATYMIGALSTGGEVIVENVIPKHLDPVTAKLAETGATVIENGDWIRVRSNGRPRPVNVRTLPYPGYPTDAQPPLAAMLACAAGTSIITDNVWDGRFKYVDELNRMGANIRVEGRTAIIEGVECLTGAPVRAYDLRAGAALIVAGLSARGLTEVVGVEHVQRGYEQLVRKWAGLGADIRLLPG